MSTLLSVRVDEIINDQLDALASQQHQTRTDVVRAALLFYFKSKNVKLKEQMLILHKIDKDDDYIGDDSW